MFPSASPEQLSLLGGLLEFNPHFRLSAQDALQYPIFEKFRQPKQERPSPLRITKSMDQIVEINEATNKRQYILLFKQVLLTEQNIL